jgi:hypothetical protein
MQRVPPRRGEGSGVVVRSQTNGFGRNVVIRPAVMPNNPNVYR